MTMSAYGDSIIKATGCAPRDTQQIEDTMRTQHSTLDGLTAVKFDRLARLSWDVVRKLRADGIYEVPLGD